jgi:hypothetical protein
MFDLSHNFADIPHFGGFNAGLRRMGTVGPPMKLKDLFRTKPRVGWRGQGGEPSPVVIGALVALVVAGAYVALIVAGHK